MFNSYGSGITSPPLTNNPFIDHSSSTTQRYPDLSQPPQVVNQSTWGNSQYSAQQQQQPQYPQQQQQWQGNPMGGMYNTQVQPQPTGFTPQSSFGQGFVSANSYGYPNTQNQQQQQQQMQQQQQQQQPTGYNPAQQQLQSPNYIAQFDPYGPISQGWGEATTTTITAAAMSPVNTSFTSTGQYSSSHINTPIASSTSFSAAGDQHPRDHIRSHKGLIEAWDNGTWKALLALFDKLKETWERRKQELDARVGVLNTQLTALQMQTQAAGQFGYAGYMQVQQYQQEVARVEGLAKEATNNADSVAASTFQMQEVFQGYRQSGDAASKRRVREATNASLQNLPDWPQPFV